MTKRWLIAEKKYTVLPALYPIKGHLAFEKMWNFILYKAMAFYFRYKATFSIYGQRSYIFTNKAQVIWKRLLVYTKINAYEGSQAQLSTITDPSSPI